LINHIGVQGTGPLADVGGAHGFDFAFDFAFVFDFVFDFSAPRGSGAQPQAFDFAFASTEKRQKSVYGY